MYAAHFAAALAIKSFSPKAPTWALLTGAFLPDLFWIAFGLAGMSRRKVRHSSMTGRTLLLW